jgi:serine protease Do
MSSFKKHSVYMAIVCVAFFAALPFANAQTRIFSNVLQNDSSGAYLGIEMDDVDANNMSKYKLDGERGVIVRSVVKGSPADTAGIKDDDVILEFGDTRVWSSLQMSRLVRETPVGRKVNLVVSRDGKRMNLSAKLERREPGRAENPMLVVPDGSDGPGRRSYQFRFPDGFGLGPDRREFPDSKPRLGVTIQPLTDQLAEFLGVPDKKGVLVATVMEGSPSAGKLKSGDVIISMDGKSIDNSEDLTRYVRNKSEGSITLNVIRDKKEITVVVSLPEEEGKGYKL